MQGGYAVTQRLAAGAVSRWDYAAIDQQRQRLYLTRGDHVDVLELPGGQLVGTIVNTQGVHGVAFSSALNLGFTSNGKSNSVTVFDLDTLAVKREFAVPGRNPDAILYESKGRRLYVFNGASNSVDVIEVTGPESMQVVASIKASGRPEFAAEDGHGRIYFNIEDNPGIDVIDTATQSITARWKLDGCDEPTGLAMDTVRNRLFSTCQNGIVAVTDAESGKRVAEFKIGEKPDAIVYDAASSTLFTSGGGGNGTLTVTQQRDADHYESLKTLVTAKGAKTMAFDEKTKSIYLPTVVGESFVVIVATKH
ncbi:MAG: YncE family protein [Microbacteriaceae bacterium]|nr:YncE family protein [Burkholderiaceae bacterium]